MPRISYQDAVALKEALDEPYGDRHQALRRLRMLWHGNFWDAPETKTGGMLSIFRDLTAGGTTVGPEVKLVRNFLHQICVKYQTYLSELPMIQVPTDPGGEPSRRQSQANRKERFLYGLWGDSNMAYSVNRLAWYMPLMGDAFMGIYPDFDRKLLVPLVRSPEYAYPVPSFDMNGGSGLEAVLFSWKIDSRWAKREFPGFKPRETADTTRDAPIDKSNGNIEVEVLEYSDRDVFLRWVDGQLVAGVEHGFGFNLFDQGQFIHVPDEPFGHGAVEQMVNLNELSNATLSLVWQSILENVYPRLVLVNPAKAPEQIDFGPGGVIPLGEGGSVQWLHPPVQAIGAQVGWLAEMERGMKEQAAMPDINFGQMHSSIITGKAVSELQGAATGSTIEMVQRMGLGNLLTSWNAKAIHMARRLWPDETLHVGGQYPQTIADLNPRSFRMSIRGGELVGSTNNVVVFSPAMDLHEKLVMQLQALGAGLISKKYARDQIGIPDSPQMEEEIYSETITDGVVATFLQVLASGATPEAAADAEKQMSSYLEGQYQAAPAGPPLPALPQLDPSQLQGGAPAGEAGGLPGEAAPLGLPAAPPSGGGEAPPESPMGPATGQPYIPLGPPGSGQPPQLPPDIGAMIGGAPGQEAGMPAAPPPDGETIELETAVEMFQGLQGITGSVYLMGEIVATGEADMIEVGVTMGDDRQVIADQLTNLAGRIQFIRVQGDPSEPFVEVTPGSPPRSGGAEE